MNIIFLRHGKAKSHDIKPDFERKLTRKGIKKLKKNLPFLASYLQDKNYLVLSSPYLRTRQTAKILLSYLDQSEPETADFIPIGNLHELNRFLRTTTADYLVIVGHEPTLSEWIFKLSSTHVVMDKGSAAEINYNPLINKKGYFNWAHDLTKLNELI